MGEIVIYKTQDKQTEVEVQFDGETVWLPKCKWQYCLIKQGKMSVYTLTTVSGKKNW